MIRHVQLRDLGGYISRIPRERHAAAVRGVRQTLQQRGRVIVNEEINATKPRAPASPAIPPRSSPASRCAQARVTAPKCAQTGQQD